MEQELNIAAILRYKPKGTKLYSRISGDCILKGVYEMPYPICVLSTNSGDWNLMEDGKYAKDGEVCLFPSKDMQDWSKFAWKKGDVLANECGMLIVMFCGWANDDYTEFNTKYDLYNDNSIGEKEVCNTSYFTKASEDVKKKFIDAIEAQYGGNLNQSTLEIEKPQFKDGDILTLSDGTIFINKDISNSEPYGYAILYENGLFSTISQPCTGDSGMFATARFATDSEKQKLFAALAKEGKRWNAETKTLEDLPKKCELEPFDKVVVRYFSNSWCADFFSNYDDKDEKMPYTCIGGSFSECLPYNDKTKHLLGTTDDWKGGEE